MNARACLLAGLVLSASLALAEDVQPEFVPPADRDVTPPGVTPAPAGEGPLIRVPPPPRPPDPPRWRRFFLPRTTDAATFSDDGKTIRIAGVTPPSVDETCRLADGGAWPCGRSALHGLRMFLRGRAVECYFPYVEGEAEITAPCRVGSTDLGLWLIAEGWARPNERATDEYRTAVAAARCARRGLWRGEEAPRSCAATN